MRLKPRLPYIKPTIKHPSNKHRAALEPRICGPPSHPGDTWILCRKRAESTRADNRMRIWLGYDVGRKSGKAMYFLDSKTSLSSHRQYRQIVPIKPTRSSESITSCVNMTICSKIWTRISDFKLQIDNSTDQSWKEGPAPEMRYPSEGK